MALYCHPAKPKRGEELERTEGMKGSGESTVTQQMPQESGRVKLLGFAAF